MRSARNRENRLFRYVTCVSRDSVHYLVFDYLHDVKAIQVVDDENLPKKVEDFIRKNLFPLANVVLVDRRKLGPYKYDRAELLGIAIQVPDGNGTSLNEALQVFCTNRSLIGKSQTAVHVHRSRLAVDSFAREMCAGHQQAIYLEDYFRSTPSFCPNCTFVDAADKYYWFDNTVPFLPLWLALISTVEYIRFNSPSLHPSFSLS